MATPAQTQVTLDASQFIASVDAIGQAIVDMNKNLQSAGAAFNGFATSTAKIEQQLQAMNTAMAAQKAATEATTKAVQALTAAQTQQSAALTAIAGATQRAADSLDKLTQASAKTGKAGVEHAKAFTFAWDGIFRLLTVTVIRRVFLDIAGAIGNSITAAAEYQESVGRIVALHQELGVSADQLSERFTNLSLAYGRSLQDTANIGRIAADQGGAQSADQIDAITNSAIRLAEVTGSTGPAAATAITAVTRAFQLTAEESQHVSNQLIHLAQSGIGVEAISGSLGRVSSQAQRLGISFSEVALLMEELKATGISDAEVMTQLGAVMNSIERPTQRMRDLMAGDGIFSPQQLIQAQRLGGALQYINRNIDEGNIQARQAVQSRRAGGGLSVADSFQARQRGGNPLDNVEGLNNTADAALRVVDATGRWNDELEKIRTAFVGQIGPQIINTILNMADRAGGLSNVIIDTGRLIAALVEPIAAVATGAVLVAQLIERIAEGVGLLSRATRENREAMAAFNTAARESMERSNTWAAGQRQLTRTALQEGTAAIAATFLPVNAELNRQADLQRERVHTLGQEIEASSKSVFGAFAAQIEALEAIAKQAESQISESLSRVQDLAEKTDKESFQDRLKSAADVSQTTPFTSASQQNNAAKLLNAQDAGANNQLSLIRDRKQRLTEEIAQLEAKGDAVSIATARRKMAELRQLTEQEYDIRAQSSRRNAEFRARSTRQDQTFNPFNREREEAARRLNAAEEAFEARRRQRLAAQQAALQAINQELRNQVRLVQEGQRNVARLPNRLLTPDGTPRENFQGAAGGRLASAEINRTIDQQIARIEQLPASIEAGIAEALRTGAITQEQADQARRRAPTEQEVAALTLQLQNQRIALEALFQNAEARRRSEANQREQIGILAEIARNTDRATAEAVAARQAQIEQLRQAQTTLNEIRGFVPDPRTVAGASSLGSEGADALTRQRARMLQEAIEEATRLNSVAVASGRPEDIARAQEAARAIAELFDRFQRGRGLLSTAPRADGLVNTTAGSEALRVAMARLTEATENRTRAETTVAEANARAEAERVRRARDILVNAGQQGMDGVQRAIDQAPEALRTLAERIRTGLSGIAGIVLPGLLGGPGAPAAPAPGLMGPPAPAGAIPLPVIQNGPPQAPVGPPQPGAIPLPVIQNGPTPVTINIPPPVVIPPPAPPPVIINGDMVNPQGYAEGGLIGNMFSNFGPDNVMIRARRGEFVMNPESTQKFYATLVRMNRGDAPRGGGYANGGTVTNSSIGNMTFNVSGSDSPEQTARAVMKIIRREQRRGNA
jgi:hypothetical protein